MAPLLVVNAADQLFFKNKNGNIVRIKAMFDKRLGPAPTWIDYIEKPVCWEPTLCNSQR